MNKDLQKDIVTPETIQAKRRAYTKKHMEKCKTMCVTLRKEQDSNIIAWLDEQENKSEAVRKALTSYIGLKKAFEKAQTEAVNNG